MNSTTSKDVVHNDKAAGSVDLEQQGTPVPCTAVTPKTLGAGVGPLDSNGRPDN